MLSRLLVLLGYFTGARAQQWQLALRPVFFLSTSPRSGWNAVHEGRHGAGLSEHTAERSARLFVDLLHLERRCPPHSAKLHILTLAYAPLLDDRLEVSSWAILLTSLIARISLSVSDGSLRRADFFSVQVDHCTGTP